jgi:hypothetical protein
MIPTGIPAQGDEEAEQDPDQNNRNGYRLRNAVCPE